MVGVDSVLPQTPEGVHARRHRVSELSALRQQENQQYPWPYLITKSSYYRRGRLEISQTSPRWMPLQKDGQIAKSSETSM